MCACFEVSWWTLIFACEIRIYFCHVLLEHVLRSVCFFLLSFCYFDILRGSFDPMYTMRVVRSGLILAMAAAKKNSIAVTC